MIDPATECPCHTADCAASCVAALLHRSMHARRLLLIVNTMLYGVRCAMKAAWHGMLFFACCTARHGADLQVDDHFEHLVLIGLGLGLGPRIERDLCDEVCVPQHLSQYSRVLSVRAAVGSNAIR